MELEVYIVDSWCYSITNKGVDIERSCGYKTKNLALEFGDKKLNELINATPSKEIQAIREAVNIAKKHGLLTEVIWSALSIDGTIREKLNYGLNEWIK